MTDAAPTPKVPSNKLSRRCHPCTYLDPGPADAEHSLANLRQSCFQALPASCTPDAQFKVAVRSQPRRACLEARPPSMPQPGKRPSSMRPLLA